MVSGRVYFPILVMLSLLPAAVMTACSGQGKQAANPDQVAALHGSAARSREAGTAKLVLTVEIPSAQGAVPLHFSGVGAIDFKGGRETLSMNIGGVTSEVIHDGTAAYSRLGMAGAPRGSATWYRSDAATAADALATGSFGVAMDDPARVLGLVATAGDVTRKGRERLSGVEAIHYKASSGGGEPIPLDIWLDLNGRVTRVRYAVPMTTGGGDGDAPSAVFTVDFLDYGSPVAISAPPAERVQAMPQGAVETSRPVLVGQK